MASVSECTFGCSVCLREKASSWRTRLAARLAFCLMFMTSAKAGSVGRILRQQQVGEADDRGQHVVEVMRDARGQLTHCLHLLALRQLHFQRLALGACRARRQRRSSSPSASRVKVNCTARWRSSAITSRRRHEGWPRRPALRQGRAPARRDRSAATMLRRSVPRRAFSDNVEEGRIGHAQHALLVDFGNADRRIVDETRQTRRRDGRRSLARHAQGCAAAPASATAARGPRHRSRCGEGCGRERHRRPPCGDRDRRSRSRCRPAWA